MSAVTVARVVVPPAVHPDRLPLYADGPFDVEGRRGGRVPPGSAVSFATYFNAFPAWHWHAFTDVVRLFIAVHSKHCQRILKTDVQAIMCSMIYLVRPSDSAFQPD